MKRITIALLVAMTGAGFLAAQPGPWGGPMMGGRGGYYGYTAPKASTIEGKLAFADTYPTVQTKDKTYSLRAPGFFYYAYTDKIADGAQVKAEGYELPAVPGQDNPGFFATKLTINGKTYDLGSRRGDFGGGRGFDGPRGGMMRGFGGPRGGGMMQGFGPQGGPMGPGFRFFGGAQGSQQAPQAKSVEGKLAFINGYPAVQAKDKTYILEMPDFYQFAYENKIAEGAQVKADGYELPSLPGQDKPYLAVTKATIGGKVLDLTQPGAGRRGFRMYGMMGGF